MFGSLIFVCVIGWMIIRDGKKLLIDHCNSQIYWYQQKREGERIENERRKKSVSNLSGKKRL